MVSNNLIELVKKQGLEIEALENYFQYSLDYTKPTLEEYVGKLDQLMYKGHGDIQGFKSDKEILIKLWEKQNTPYKWEY